VMPHWHYSAGTVGGLAQGRFFLSLYGGVGEGAKWFATHGGESAVVDMAHHPRNDLCLPRAQADVDTLARRADVLGLDLPCSSWSLARRAPSWSSMPSALRCSQGSGLWGLPHLPPADRKRVRIGNVQVKHAVRLIKASVSSGRSGYLENPLGSRVWRAIERLLPRQLKTGEIRVVRTCLCQYGVAWKKPTRLLVWGPSSKELELKWCRSTAGKCARTHRPHVELSGFTSSGTFMTSQAQVYPRQLVAHLLSQLLERGP